MYWTWTFMPTTVLVHCMKLEWSFDVWERKIMMCKRQSTVYLMYWNNSGKFSVICCWTFYLMVRSDMLWGGSSGHFVLIFMLFNLNIFYLMTFKIVMHRCFCQNQFRNFRFQRNTNFVVIAVKILQYYITQEIDGLYIDITFNTYLSTASLSPVSS